MTIKLEFKERDLLCALGLEFLGEFLDVVGIDVEEVGRKVGQNPFKWVPVMIYHSAIIEGELSGKPVELTKREVINLLENAGGIASPQAKYFLNEWTKSMTRGVPPAEPAPVDEPGAEPKKK